MKKTVYTLCFMCSIRCPIKVVVEDNEIISIEGNPHVAGMNGVCPRGASGTSLLKDTERPLCPMIRAGERGSGLWKQVSWEEALDFTADKLKEIINQYKARSIVWGERTVVTTDLAKTFMKAIGSPNHFTHDTICKGSVNTACRSMLGYKDPQIGFNFGNTKLIVSYGRNIFESIEVKAVNGILNGIEKGAKLVYIDPRVTLTAAKAHQYFMIRPGTDLALNYALMHVIIKENLYDAGYVRKWVKGFGQLCAFIEPYTPQWAEEETGISAQQIINLAHEAGRVKPSVIFHIGYRGAHHPNEIYFRRSILILNALMGSIEAKGGIFIKKGPAAAGLKGMRKFSDAEFPPFDNRRFDGVGDKFPIVDAAHGKGQMLPYAILKEDPYPVKALIAFRFDPLLSIPDYQQNLEAIKKLDFIAAIDINYSETAWYADIILPESTYLERTDPARMVQGLKPAVFLRQQCIPPQYDTRPGAWIIKQLAERMGIGKYFPYNSIEELLNYQLADMNIDIKDFAETGFVSLSDKPIWWDRESGIKFKTPSGKIEIISALMEENGYSSLVPYEKVERLSDSFRLMVGRNAQHTHVSTQNNPYLNKLVSENTLWINKKRAEALGISDGDLVEVTSKVGKVKIKAFVTDLIHPEGVFMLHGFGQRVPVKTRCYLKGASDTDIVENTSDIIGGSPALDNTLVKVSKVKG